MKAKQYAIKLPVQDYDLDATLLSGQAFGWEVSSVRGGREWWRVAGFNCSRVTRGNSGPDDGGSG
jgi:hypothetical protein